MVKKSTSTRSAARSLRPRRLNFEPLEQRQMLDAAPVIGEFMAVASGPLRDDDGETPDWIEVYNAGDAPANLAGWHLTNTATDLDLWQFPDVTLQADARLVVFASGKDRTRPNSPLHTNFTLDGGGGYLALVEPNGTTIASLFEAFPDQKPLISYGISAADGPHAGEARAFVSPTPGAPNGIGFQSPDVIGIVINEINYNTEDNTELTEFIELVNTNDYTVDVAGWFFDDGIDYVFPTGSTIAAGEMIVITRNAEHLLETFGVEAFGEFGENLGDEAARTLNNDGEKIGLRAAAGGRVDAVDYGVGAPWPVAANGEGSSIELIHPSLDNDLAGSWRSSGFGAHEILQQQFIELGATWRYRKGLSEASSPTDAWRVTDFVEDGTWLTGPAPIGMGYSLNQTVLNDMEDNYISVFLRKQFTIELPEDIPRQLEMQVYIDDGAIIWINGVEVVRAHVSPGEKAYNARTGESLHGRRLETFLLERADQYLVAGVNTVAIQAINRSIGSASLSIDIALSTVDDDSLQFVPTPGSRNSVFALNAPPQTRQIKHSPKVPVSGEETVITAKVTDPDGVESVELLYQVVAPGDYIPYEFARLPSGGNLINLNQPRQLNPAFEDPANWTRVVMRDDGLGSDETAGDDVYTAVVPGQNHRTLMRYRVEVADKLGASARLPYEDDPSLNFAYFVYDGVPEYEGISTEVLESLPVYHLLVRAEDMVDVMAYSSSDQLSRRAESRFSYNWPATFFYDGIVYDHINFRTRGGNGRYQASGKRSMRFRFNNGHYFQVRDQDGNLRSEKQRTLTTAKGSENRGTLTYALNEGINSRLFNTIGVPASETHWFHFRVIDDAEEAPDKWRGDFWGLNFALETYDVRFLNGHGLEKGNLYKLIDTINNPIRQQRYQAAGAVTNGSDHNTIEGFSPNEGNLTGSSSADFIDAHVNLEIYYAYHAMTEAIRHYDYWPSANKNLVYYFEPDYLPENNNLGKLWTLPWDTDASWGPTWNNGHDAVYNSLFPASGGGSDGGSTPELWPGYFNAVRELRDLLWQPDQINPLIDEIAAIIAPFEVADRARWKNAPADAGNYNGLGGAGSSSFAALVRDLKNFAFVGGSWPGGGVGGGGRGAHLDSLQASRGEGSQIPRTPTISYVGAAGFPSNELALRTSSFSDPQGAGTFAAVQWRLAEITDPDAPAFNADDPVLLEWNASWDSGELTTFSNQIEVPAVAAQAGHTYRARVRMMDSSGRWSHWSAPLELTAGEPSGLPIDALQITEIHYNPGVAIGSGLDNDDFEFIELKNNGTDTIDLAGVQFTDGIAFDFTGSNVTSLAAGEYTVVVKDQVAFKLRYPGVDVGRIAGQFTSGNLRNSGENLTLVEGSTGRVLFDFEFGGGWYDLVDGEGFSLSLRSEDAAASTFGQSETWRPSSSLHGSPAGPDSGAVPLPGAIVINEVLAHSDMPLGDWIELHNTTTQSVDVGGWFLSDTLTDLTAYEIPVGLSIPAGGYLVLTEADHFGGAFALSEVGDDVILQAGGGGELAGFRAEEDFFASEREVTLGRHIKSNGAKDFVAMVVPTPNAANAAPVVGPVVIQELFYHPEDRDASEFVELRNITDAPVSLAGWYFEGIRFAFPEGTSIEPDGLVIVAPVTPEEFRLERGLPETVSVFGPYLGALDNGGESFKLYRPGEPEADGVVPAFLIDRVTYDDKFPWPVEADGEGASLQRISPEAFGNDPANWVASVGGTTPGDIIPQVTQVLVGSSQWSPAFLSALEARGLGEGGFSIPGGPDQLTPLSQQFVDQISLRFSLDVQIQKGDLVIAGINESRYPLADFTYDANQFVATWTLKHAIRADKVLLRLSGVHDKTGRPLDGNWVDAVSSFPSGNGILESNDHFSFRLNVLIGDANVDGQVGRSDLLAMISRLSTTTEEPAYLPRLDVNADGRIDLADLRSTLLRVGTRLPSGEPLAPIGSPARVATEAFFTRLGAPSPGPAGIAADSTSSNRVQSSGAPLDRSDQTARRTSRRLFDRSLGKRLRRPLDRVAVDAALDEPIVATLSTDTTRHEQSGRRIR